MAHDPSMQSSRPEQVVSRKHDVASGAFAPLFARVEIGAIDANEAKRIAFRYMGASWGEWKMVAKKLERALTMTKKLTYSIGS